MKTETVAGAFRGKHILVTGVTGFCGQGVGGHAA